MLLDERYLDIGISSHLLRLDELAQGACRQLFDGLVIPVEVGDIETDYRIQLLSGTDIVLEDTVLIIPYEIFL